MLQPNSLFNREFWTILFDDNKFIPVRVVMKDLVHSPRLRAFYAVGAVTVYDCASATTFNSEDEAKAVCDELNQIKGEVNQIKGGVQNEK